MDAWRNIHARRACVEGEDHGHKDAHDGGDHECDVDVYPLAWDGAFGRDGEEESYLLVLAPLVESVLEVHEDGTGAWGVSCDDGTSCPLRNVPSPSLVGDSNVHDHDRDPSALEGKDVLDQARIVQRLLDDGSSLKQAVEQTMDDDGARGTLQPAIGA